MPLNPSTTTVYARSAFYPSLRFTLSLHFTHSLHFTPGPQSAVRSPQSSFYTDRKHKPAYLCELACLTKNAGHTFMVRIKAKKVIRPSIKLVHLEKEFTLLGM